MMLVYITRSFLLRLLMLILTSMSNELSITSIKNITILLKSKINRKSLKQHNLLYQKLMLNIITIKLKKCNQIKL